MLFKIVIAISLIRVPMKRGYNSNAGNIETFQFGHVRDA
jgi:hypothetical protein